MTQYEPRNSNYHDHLCDCPGCNYDGPEPTEEEAQRIEAEMGPEPVDSKAMEQFTHNQYTFRRWEHEWCMDSAWMLSDLYREMDSLVQEGIPLEAMQIVCKEYDRSSGHRYYRLAIAHSADAQVEALAERIHQTWLAQKAIDDARYAKQYEEAKHNQEAQGIGAIEWDI